MDPKKKKDEQPDAMAGLSPGMQAGMAKVQGAATPTTAPTLSRAASPAAGGGAPAMATLPSLTPSLGAFGERVANLPGKVSAVLSDLGDRVSGKYAAPIGDQLAYQISGREPVSATEPTLVRAPAQAGTTTPAAPVKPAVAVGAAAAGGAAPAKPTLRPGDVNTFTGVNGVTRAVPGMTPAPANAGAVNAAASTSTATVPPAVATPTLQRPGVPAANVQSSRSIIENPGEEQRRFDIDLSGATFQPGRSRGARQLQSEVVRGLFGQNAQQQDLKAREQNAALDANVALARAGAEESGQNYRAELGEAGDTARTEATLRRQAESDALNGGQVVTGADGTASLVRGSTARPITGADGKPFRPQGQNGSITDRDLFEAYNKQVQALNENALLRPEERAAQLTELQARPEFASMLQKIRGTGAAGAPPAGAIEKLQANPSLAADFDAKYGAGASARYLTR